MEFSLIIRTRPDDAQRWQQAQRFAKAAIKMGHSIRQCFFQGEGVLTAALPQAHTGWVTLAEQTGTELLLCSQAAETHSVTAEYPVALGGLGAVIEASVKADRVISFV